MRAVELQSFGPGGLTLVGRAEPSPLPDEALVRMRYASLNFRDQVVAAGGYGSQIRAPLVPLSDGAGEVVAVGAGVRRLRPGDRVMTCFFQDWIAGAPTAEALRSSLGGPLDGTASELRCLPEHGLCKLPDGLALDEAAALPCAAVTAWNALATLDRVGPEHTVLVQGTGGVSLFALQFAKLMGARVIATSSSDEKLERLRALGADHVISYTRTTEWGKAARELTFGRGVDHVVEVGGAGTLAQSLRATAVGGTISLIGVLAGARNEIHLPHVFLPQIRLQGVVVGSRETAERMLHAIGAHGLRPVLDARRFALDSMREAFEHLASGRHFGKVIVEVTA
jgi:NADPH:quinone reductase-like Zn-dependent oxidoreductase